MQEALKTFLRDAAARRSAGERVVAVFDADGTLWRGDSGDVFFAHQRRQDTMPAAPLKGDALLALYDAEVARDTAHGYGLMAQWNRGVAEADLQAWARDCWAAWQPSPVLASQRALVAELQGAGVEVWVVSASLWWLVAEGAAALGIPPERVIGTRTKVKDGRLTGDWANQVPYRAGKAALVRQFIGTDPDLVSGNSMGDYEMMLLARKLILVMNTAGPADPYYGTERELRALAEKSPTPATWLVEGS